MTSGGERKHNPKTLKEAFEKYAGNSFGEVCVEWRGTVSTHGYGQLHFHRNTRRAHRVAYELHVGEIPAGLDVCHKCDNRKCVNYKHLFVGTRSENMLDAKSKGRLTAYLYPERTPRGEKHPDAKLTDSIVRYLRSIPENEFDGVVMAKRYSVSKTTIYRARSGMNWTHIPSRLSAGEVKLGKEPCKNCGEEVKECACIRNKCLGCGNIVGNITFTFCDDCFEKKRKSERSL